MTEVRTTSSTGGEKGVKPERYEFIPVGPLAAVARMYGRGAEKYDETSDKPNWRKGYEWSKSYAAAMRHLTQFWGGEDIDSEMKESHLAAVVFHCFSLMEFSETHPEFDDRYNPKPPLDLQFEFNECAERVIDPELIIRYTKKAVQAKRDADLDREPKYDLKTAETQFPVDDEFLKLGPLGPNNWAAWIFPGGAELRLDTSKFPFDKISYTWIRTHVKNLDGTPIKRKQIRNARRL